MQTSLSGKVKAMFWDIPENRRSELVNEIMTDPVHIFNHNEQLFIRALNSLKWYELTELISKENLVLLLTDSTIQKLFPVQRRTYYTNARRLLSKYSLSAPGQPA